MTLSNDTIEICEESWTCRLAGKELVLTATEFRLIVYLAKNNGRALSRHQILDEIRGAGWFASDRIVDTHVYGLRKKLGKHGIWLKAIRTHGYKIEIPGLKKKA